MTGPDIDPSPIDPSASSPSGPPLRILVNATSARVGGGLSFLTHQLRAYAAHHPEDQLTVLGAPWNNIRLSEATGLDVELVPVESTPERIRFEQSVLPNRARDFDLLFNPANLAPVRPMAVPSVLMLQNLAYFGNGPSFASHQVPVERLKRRMVRASIRQCDAVICPSQALADAVIADRPRARSKMHVIRPGPFAAQPSSAGQALESGQPRRHHGADYATAKQVLQTHFEGRGYVMSVANYYDYKRLNHVVAAWAIADANGLDHDLLMVGSVPTEILMALRELAPKDRRHRIHFHGLVRDPEDLRVGYQGAAAVICLSALESLSLVPVEAAALGVPTVLSDIAAHREFPKTDGQHQVPVGDLRGAAAALEVAVGGPRPEPTNLLSDWQTHTGALHKLFHQLTNRAT